MRAVRRDEDINFTLPTLPDGSTRALLKGDASIKQRKGEDFVREDGKKEESPSLFSPLLFS